MGTSILCKPRRGRPYGPVELKYLKGPKTVKRDEAKLLGSRVRESRKKAVEEIHGAERRDWSPICTVLDALYGLSRRRSESIGEGVEPIVPFTHAVLSAWCSPKVPDRSLRRTLATMAEMGLIEYQPGGGHRPSLAGLVHLHIDNEAHTEAQVLRDLDKGGELFRPICHALLGRAEEARDAEYFDVGADEWDEAAMEEAQRIL